MNLSSYRTYLTAEAGARALFDTGPIGHELALTATTFANEVGAVAVFGTAFATNIYSPTITARPNIATPAANKTSTSNLSSLAIADTLTAAEKRVQLTVGARLQQVKAANFNAATGAQTTSYDQSALSPSVSLVVKPLWKNVTFYGNWIQGLQQGATVQPPFTNAGDVFPPYKTTQYEVGVKVDWGKLTTTVSAFQISQPSLLTNVATNTQFLGGEQVNQGLEFNFFGEVTEGVRVLGGAMFLNAALTKTQGGTTDGWIAPFSPGVQLNLATEWDLPFVPGLTLNGRVVYTGSQYIDTTWPRRSLPEWTRFDIGARYAFENPGAKGKLLVARFNVDNLFDANYWAGGSGETLLNLGAPRTFRLSLTADF
jgi:iron complex outermembrane receptor protein